MALKGTSGNDIFFGSLFAEQIFGFGGDDFIKGSPGADTIDGGSGSDVVDYSEFFTLPFDVAGKAVDVDLERPVQFGGFAEGDVLIGIERITGSRENDSIRGDGAANVFFGEGGDDVLEGRGGDDALFGDFAVILVAGSAAGDDHLDGGAGDDRLRGQDGNDVLIGGRDDDELFGEDGDDTLFGDPGIDLIDGGAGVDTVTYGNSLSPVSINLAAGTGSGGDATGDVLVGVENITGSVFDDTLVGSAAANVLSGGFGNDTLSGLGGADTLNGGDGSDTATYTASASGVAVNLADGTGTSGDANGDTLSAIENVIGSGFTDVLVGNASANVLDGRGGADFLLGGAGNDLYIVDNAGDAVGESAGQGVDEVRTSVSYALAAASEVETLRTTNDNGTAAINLTGSNAGNQIIGNNGDNVMNGGGGADTLIGARGLDTLTGGTGADLFVWRDTNETGVVANTADVIIDFSPAQGDLIDLSGIDANIFASGNQAFTFIGEAAFTGASGEVNVIHVNGDTIIQMQTGIAVDSEASIRIPGIVTLDASMFVL